LGSLKLAHQALVASLVLVPMVRAGQIPFLDEFCFQRHCGQALFKALNFSPIAAYLEAFDWRMAVLTGLYLTHAFVLFRLSVC
jgi:hypothetical protein